MSEAGLILAINLLLGIVLFGAFLGLYFHDRSKRQHFWYSAGFIAALASGLLEMALPYLDSALSVRYAIFATFLVCEFCLVNGLGIQYRVVADRRLLIAVVVAGLVLNVFTLFMARNSLARMVLYQAPYVAMAGVCTWTAFRGESKRFGDAALVGLLALFTLHFASRPFAALVTGGMGRTASDYLATFYAVTTQFDVAILTIAIAVTLLGLAVADLIGELERKARHDSLTGILNREGFARTLRERLSEAPTGTVTSCLVACDLDNFKSINDTFGHGAGDAVIRAFASLLARSVREQDLCARIGGEEFLVFLHNLDGSGARLFAEAVRTAFASVALPQLPQARRCTASFGITELCTAADVENACSRADRALYAAKRNGRNRVECGTANGEVPPVPVTLRVV